MHNDWEFKVIFVPIMLRSEASMKRTIDVKIVMNCPMSRTVEEVAAP
jgi:hypothetical protein